MSEIDGVMREVTHAITNTMRELRDEFDKQLSNATAQAEGGRIEGDIDAEKQRLGALDQDPHGLPREAEGAVPLEAQADGPWPFGEPADTGLLAAELPDYGAFS